MKIFHCLNHFLPNNVAGTEIYTASLIHFLSLKNINSVVVIPNYGKPDTEEYTVNGIRVIQYGEPSVIDRKLIMGKKIPEGIEAFKKVLETEKPDIIQFHVAGMSNGITRHHVSLSKKMGFKTIMTFHIAGYSCKTNHLMYKDKVPCDGVIDVKKCTWCNYTVRGIPRIKRHILYASAMAGYTLNYDTSNWESQIGTALGFPFIIKKLKNDLLQLAGNCDKMVVISNWYKNILLRNGIAEDKLELITQGLPLQENNIVPPKIKIAEGVKLVFIGRIIYSKGLHLLINALKQLPEKNISLDIYGHINEDDYTKECIAQSADIKSIRWKGILLPAELLNILKNYDLLCIPSVICEMSPLVIQQAFAAGIPVLASEVYGNSEQITDSLNGWLFKFKNSDDLKIKLEQLVAEPGKIQEAKKNIPAVRNFSAVADEYEQLYRRIINTGREINN
ncbi:MAG: glycosyltransferase [Ginsengibacter sp.]